MRKDSMRYLKTPSSIPPKNVDSPESSPNNSLSAKPSELKPIYQNKEIKPPTNINIDKNKLEQRPTYILKPPKKIVNNKTSPSRILNEKRAKKQSLQVNTDASSNIIDSNQKATLNDSNITLPNLIPPSRKSMSTNFENEIVKIKEQKNNVLKELEKIQAELEFTKASSSKSISELTESLNKSSFQLQVEKNLRSVAESKLATMECELAELSSNIQVEAQNIVVSERKDRKSQVEKLILKNKEIEDLLVMERAQVSALKDTIERLGTLLDVEKSKNDKLSKTVDRQYSEISAFKQNLPFLKINIDSSNSNSLDTFYKKISSSDLSPASNSTLPTHYTGPNSNFSPDSFKPIFPFSRIIHSLDLANFNQLDSINDLQSRCINLNNINSSNNTKNIPEIPSWISLKMGFFESDLISNDLSDFIYSPSDKDAYQSPFFLKIYKEELEPTITTVDDSSYSLRFSNSLFPSWNKFKKVLNSIQDNSIIIEKCYFTEDSSPSLTTKSNSPLNQLVDSFKHSNYSPNFTSIIDLENLKRDGTSGFSDWFSFRLNRNSSAPHFEKSPTLIEPGDFNSNLMYPILKKYPLQRNHTTSNDIPSPISTSPDFLGNKNLVSLSPEILKSICYLCENEIFSNRNISLDNLNHSKSCISGWLNHSPQSIPSFSPDAIHDELPQYYQDSVNYSYQDAFLKNNELSASSLNTFYFKFRHSEYENSRKSICFKCHSRILSVCEFFRYIRLVRSGLVKNLDIREIKFNLTKLRTLMWANRVGSSIALSNVKL
ncbi:hypothetical protein AYI70_g6032 [Smittium culicis]|uniref:GDP/GTP exchange factor Sec2 N-terminal domain-containing protein n=1 Tax=Smittium culicis TaxID=133412 RepID=A0A1R1XRV3_9FUNG|nr:hypothetical protein AYI70_g6032 [Smittium culicis]